jgi:glycosyltransferase involved in cell wall biosynthesis
MHLIISSVSHFSTLAGGNERYAHELALGLTESGHEVTYLTSSPVTHPESYPYRFIIIPLSFFHHQPLPSYRWFNPPINLPIDLFHACGSGIPLHQAAYAMKSYHLPTLLTFQAPNHPSGIIHHLGSSLEKWCIGQSYRAILTSSPNTQLYCQHLWPHLKSSFIPLMVSPPFLKAFPDQIILKKSYHLDPQARHLLFVARLDHHHYYKGLSVLLTALTLIPAPIHLTIVGDGEMLSTYRHQVAKLKLLNRVTFRGYVPENDLPALYRAHDLFIFPSTSDSEGFGLSLFEAMAVGIPTLTTTAIGLYSWLKPKQCTVFVPPNDSKSLAQAITSRLANNNQMLIFKAQKLAHTLTRDQMVKNTLTLYHQLIHLC